MGIHTYLDPGPRTTRTHQTDGITTFVTLTDGTDQIDLAYTDLDTLDETCRLLEEARAHHVTQIANGRSDTVRADVLEPDDLAVIDGELILVCTVALEAQHVTILFARKYAGLYDLNGDRSIRVLRTQMVKRILPTADLKAVG